MKSSLRMYCFCDIKRIFIIMAIFCMLTLFISINYVYGNGIEIIYDDLKYPENIIVNQFFINLTGDFNDVKGLNDIEDLNNPKATRRIERILDNTDSVVMLVSIVKELNPSTNEIVEVHYIFYQVSGGKLSRDNWIKMARMVNEDAFTGNKGWVISDNQNVVVTFSSDYTVMPIDCSKMFKDFKGYIVSLFTLNGIKFTQTTDMSEFLCGANLKNLGSIIFEGEDLGAVENLSYMFKDSNIIDLPFYEEDKIKTITDMTGMFLNAKHFNDYMEFDTTNVKSMKAMLKGAESFNKELDLKADSLADISEMCSGTKITGIRFSGFNNNRIINAAGAFDNIDGSLESLEFSNLYNMVIPKGAFAYKYNVNNLTNEKISKKNIPIDNEFRIINSDSYSVKVCDGYNRKFILSDDKNVVASFNEQRDKLIVSGNGKINREKWFNLLSIIKHNNEYKSHFDLYFQADGGVIEFPEDCDRFFHFYKKGHNNSKNILFDGQIFGLDRKNVDTSNVVNMVQMFWMLEEFNQPIDFDLSSVEDMSDMFANTKSFNQPLAFDTSNVKDMNGMFIGARAFNQNLKFDLSSCEDISFMFAETGSFNGKLNFSNMQNVEKMKSMFWDAQTFNQPINFDTTDNLKTVSDMFLGAKMFNSNINIKSDKLEDMSAMFLESEKYNQPINFDTSNVTDMSLLFERSHSYNQPISFNTSNVVDMTRMFKGAQAFNQPLDFDYSKVEHTEDMFADCKYYEQLSKDKNFNELIDKEKEEDFLMNPIWQFTPHIFLP